MIQGENGHRFVQGTEDLDLSCAEFPPSLHLLANGKVPIRKKIEIWRQLDILRQTILGSLALPDRKEIGKY